MDLERELKRLTRQIRPGLIGATSNPNRNLRQVIDELKANPRQCEALSQSLGQFLGTHDFVTALTETGLTLESGAFTEIYRRLEYKILPKPTEDDVLAVLAQTFDGQADLTWLERIDREEFAVFLSLVLPAHEQAVEPLAPQLFMSLEVLSLRLAGLGYDPLVTKRMRAEPSFQHAFMEVVRHVHGLLEGNQEPNFEAVSEALERCERAIDWMRARRSVDGASLQLTYRLMKMRQVIHRMFLILSVIESVLGEWKPEPALDLFFEIVLAELRRFDLCGFLEQNVELLAYQVTEHTGRAGEHYITRNWQEWKLMFKSAAWGGVIVAAIAAVKVLFAKLHLPLGVEAFGFGTIYAIGFLGLHAAGATLAAKQPAMTASTLSASLDEASNSEQALGNLADTIICVIRSQLAALFGNFLLAFPVAVVFALPFFWLKIPLFDASQAQGMIDSLHPVFSLALWYAAIAGVCLFVSGLLAGFADNWFVFNRVGRRLKRSAVLERWFRADRLDHVIGVIDRNLGFWVGNITLGYFLGSMVDIGKILGLPLDIRHITFSSANLGQALTTLRFHAPVSSIVLAAIGVFVIGLVNLGVSFSLSLFVAIKSRRIRFSQTRELLRLIGRRFIKNPRPFFIPKRSAT